MMGGSGMKRLAQSNPPSVEAWPSRFAAMLFPKCSQTIKKSVLCGLRRACRFNQDSIKLSDNE
jgi:hypothetical protein